MWQSKPPRRPQPQQNDIRFDARREARIKHHSAKGEVVRNVGSFTRGTQLVRLEYMMVWQGVKVPVLVGLSCFAVLLCTLIFFRMHEHETQLVLMRTLAKFWAWCDLNLHKQVNLTLPSGDIIAIPMGAVPYNPFVEVAWDIFTRCFLASFIGAAFLTVPLTMWFTNLAHDRGTDILKERHERGALLVEPDVLIGEINQYNRAKLIEQAERREEKFDPQKVLNASIETRLKHGFHVPYTIAGIPYPFDLERTHGMLIGTTGTGKTTILLRMIEQARQRGHRCVIFDLTGVFVQHFYDPERDYVLNPIDNRCPPWSVFSDCSNLLEFSAAANALYPSPNDGGDPFWTMSARTLFVEMCMKLYERRERSNAALTHHLMYAKLKDLEKSMKGTIAGPLTSTDSARMAESIRAVVNNQAQILRYLPDTNEQHPKEFSIREWVKNDRKDGSILFITSSKTHLNITKPLLSLWMDLAVNSVLETERNVGLKIWFLFDEVQALQRLPSLESGLQTARAYGGAFLLGIHSFEGLVETYGKEGAVNLSALARTKIILTAADRTTADFCADQIGFREVREVDEAYSIGAAMSRDAATITPRTEVKPLIMPDDIMNFPSMYGIIKFPEGFPAAHIKLNWKAFPVKAKPFDEKKSLTQTVYRAPANDIDDHADGDAGRENANGKSVEMQRELDAKHDPLADANQAKLTNIDAREMTSADMPKPDDQGDRGDEKATPYGRGNIDDVLGRGPRGSGAEGSAKSSSQRAQEQTSQQGAKPTQRDQVATNEMRSGVSAVDPNQNPHHHRPGQTPEKDVSRDKGDDFGIGD